MQAFPAGKAGGYPQTLDYAGRATNYKHSSLLGQFVKYVCKNVYNIGSWDLYYKTFYVRNLRIFVMSYSVCPWQAFPAFVGETESLPKSGAPERCLNWVGSGLTRKH